LWQWQVIQRGDETISTDDGRRHLDLLRGILLAKESFALIRREEETKYHLEGPTKLNILGQRK